jgi:hypothetical protein
MFESFWGAIKNKKKEIKKEYIEDSELEKTRQNSGARLETGRGIKKEDGLNTYGENAYNLPGYEDEIPEGENKNRLKDLSSGRYVPIEDVADKDAEEAIYEQAGKIEDKEEFYDSESEFMKKAINILEADEFAKLFSFLRELDDSDTRKYYLGAEDEKGDFVPPVKKIPKEITELIKKVNTTKSNKAGKEAKKQRSYIKSAEFKHNSKGEVISAKEESTAADKVRFKIKEAKKKIVSKKANKEAA